MSANATVGEAPSRYEDFDSMPIGGHWREGSSGEARADTDPYSGDVLAELTLANASDLEEAYRSARDAQ